MPRPGFREFGQIFDDEVTQGDQVEPEVVLTGGPSTHIGPVKPSIVEKIGVVGPKQSRCQSSEGPSRWPATPGALDANPRQRREAKEDVADTERASIRQMKGVRERRVAALDDVEHLPRHEVHGHEIQARARIGGNLERLLGIRTQLL